MDKRFRIQTKSKANKKSIIMGDNYRITVLTNALVRLEYNKDGKFEDRPTQIVWNRDFEEANFKVVEDKQNLEISTENFRLCYRKGEEFNQNSLTVYLSESLNIYKNSWSFGEKNNTFKGTCRTLDGVDGETELEEGIIDWAGINSLDDSKSLVINEDGFVESRKGDVVDMYVFAYGRHHLDSLKAFYNLTGNPPLLPRYALGNWWSRYWEYSETEYLELMDKFDKEDLPFSVCVIDMDWHLVKNLPQGNGWTGYTWNKSLFPDPKRFMDELHKQNRKITLNLHPADGVRSYEDMYLDIAKEMGVDYENGQTVEFDISSPKFIEAYFKYLHHPLEKDGVDFWWMDWQQGTRSKLDGLDPLWMLNHYHTLDIQRDGKRPLLFSRYSGPGSHRYPVGFSGDTAITWESLKFQPYFTSTASNIGYTWWSHDIGGHWEGERCEQLYARWVQYGVFSPIMRLHSSKDPFIQKEPWNFNKDIESVAGDFLRLRHQLIPYIYTMNYQNTMELIPFIKPLYYYHTEEHWAYNMPNQFYFGTELMVAPITSKIDEKTCLASETVWLPEGKWVDIFTNKIYNGNNKKVIMSRPIETIPVLLKAGGIVPMAKHNPNSNNTDNPVDLDVMVFLGKNNTFNMYEDDGETKAYLDGNSCYTKMEVVCENDNHTFKIHPATGDLSHIPNKRNIRVFFKGISKDLTPTVYVGNKKVEATTEFDTAASVVCVESYDVSKELSIVFEGESIFNNNADYLTDLFNMLNKCEIKTKLKTTIYNTVKSAKNVNEIIFDLQALEIENNLMNAILEIIL